MLEYFDKLLFNAIVEYNTMINRCMDDPMFAAMVDSSEIGDAMVRYMCKILFSAESAGAISRDDWSTIRHIIGHIGLEDEDPDLDLNEPLRYEVEA